MLAYPECYAIATGAYVSLWCDELAAERQAARNWAEVVRRPAPKHGQGK